MHQTAAAPKTAMQRFHDVVERAGNMVPHPVFILLVLIAIVILLLALLGAAGAGVTFERINPETHKIETDWYAAQLVAYASHFRPWRNE